MKKIASNHIINKLLKTNDNKKLLKASREKKPEYVLRNKGKNTSYVLSETV